MNNERLKKLEEKTFAITNSEFPIGDFLNDIKQNKDPNYNKKTAYEDFEKIVDKFYELTDLNKGLKNENRVLNINIDGLFKTNHFLNKIINLLEYTPTLEEVKREWEALGYKWEENEIYIHITKRDKLLCVTKDICISKQDKEYCVYDEDEDYSCLYLLLQEHQLLTKTFKALGWM